MTPLRAIALLIAATIAAGGCGAKTGLLLEELDAEVDADVDVEPDAEVDAEVEVDADVEVCRPEPVQIDWRRAEVTFVIDRSASMQWALVGQPGIPGRPSRWELLRDALAGSLAGVDHLLEVGGKFFPRIIRPGEVGTPEATCQVDEGLELEPRPNGSERLLDLFETTFPEGGTPTAPALAEVRDALERQGRPDIARFVVLATDGGPNCNLDIRPGEDCLCTGPVEYCDESVGGTYNCLDDERTLAVIDDIAAGLEVPLFVIGIDDPTRPDLADFLDQMAIAGDRPRPEPAARRFYSVQRPEELDEALEHITETIALCVFFVSGADDERLELRLDGEVVPRDAERLDGWDWTDRDAGELTLYGESCDRVSLPGAMVEAWLTCEASWP